MNIPTGRRPGDVLFISKPLSPPFDDGGKRFVSALVRHLQLPGDRRLHLMTLRDAPTGVLPRHAVAEPLYRSSRKGYTLTPGDRLRLIRRLIKRDDEIGYHHYFFAPNPITSLAARAVRLAARRRQIKTLQTILSQPRARGAALKRLLFADVNIALSRFTADLLTAAGAKNTIIIPPGIDLDATAAAAAGSADGLKATYGLADRIAVLHAGDWEFSRASGTLLRTIASVSKSAPEVKFVIASRRKTRRSRYYELRFKSELAIRRLGNNVVFTGRVPDLPPLLAACDIVILPAGSLFAKLDLPLTLLEAMALGKPVIISDLPPLNELFAGVEGLLHPPGDHKMLSALIVDLAHHEQWRRRLGAINRKLAAERYDIRVVAESYRRLYT